MLTVYAMSPVIHIADLRRRFAHAPNWWLAAVDRERRPLGLEALAIATPAAPPRRRSPPEAVVVGVVCPGVSVPVAWQNEERAMPEAVHVDAFKVFMRLLAKGSRHVELQDGHDGPRLASTRDGSLRLTADRVVGIVIDADLRALPAGLLAELKSGRVGLSAGIQPERGGHRVVWRDGRELRMIFNASLRHIAIVRPGRGLPAYRAAVASVATAVDAAAVAAARAAAIRAAVR